jgi:hypothetical protein
LPRPVITDGLRRALLTAVCLAAVAHTGAQADHSRRAIVLPNPQLIRCHATACSQLWNREPGDKDAVYPAQVLNDVVNGEVVGLTAVYDKSVSTSEVRAAINARYGHWQSVSLNTDTLSMWRVEPEQFAISVWRQKDGTQLTYLKFTDNPRSLVPSAHIFGDGK